MAQQYQEYEETEVLTDNSGNNEETSETIDPTELGFEIISWKTPEYFKHERSHIWYALFAIVGIGMLVYAVLNSDFLFAVIIILGGLILIFNDARHPELVDIVITTEGVIVGNKFYDYDEIEHFYIIYKPIQNLKRVYFHFKSTVRHRLSLPLHDVDPLFVRENLVKYLREDLEEINEPRSEILSRLLRL